MSEVKNVTITNPKNETVTLTPDQAKKVRPILSNDQLTKSEKIRQIMAVEGMSQYKTAKVLGIIPQFVNNVMKKVKDKETKETK